MNLKSGVRSTDGFGVIPMDPKSGVILMDESAGERERPVLAMVSVYHQHLASSQFLSRISIFGGGGSVSGLRLRKWFTHFIPHFADTFLKLLRKDSTHDLSRFRVKTL